MAQNIASLMTDYKGHFILGMPGLPPRTGDLKKPLIIAMLSDYYMVGFL